MRENAIKAAVSAAAAALLTYGGVLAVPLAVLLAVMVLDYLSGMAKAWIAKTLCSRTGIVGIVKKVGYLAVVAVGMTADWAIHEVLVRCGVPVTPECYVGLLVVVWLIINEVLSVVENVAAIGVPVPPFLQQIMARLKSTAEQRGEVHHE